MPITKHGVTAQDAILEAATRAYAGRVIFDCFSIEHPLLPDVLYFVNNREPFTASLPDGGGVVTFEACPVRISKPEESDQAATPEIKLDIDNISGGISRALRIIRGSLDPMVLTDYLYANDQTSGPVVMPPTVLYITSIAFDENSATLAGSFGDAGNYAIPALTVKRGNYPALSRQS